MKSLVHGLAGSLALVTIAAFWLSTMISELFLSAQAVAWVKRDIAWGLLLLIPLLIVTGGSGFALAGKVKHPLIRNKRRRMPLIAMNGLLVLVPAALYLSWKAQAGAFDGGFYAVQGLELLAGATNLLLMGLNARDGMRLHRSANAPDSRSGI